MIDNLIAPSLLDFLAENLFYNNDLCRYIKMVIQQVNKDKKD
jgi:hypothetical protein